MRTLPSLVIYHLAITHISASKLPPSAAAVPRYAVQALPTLVSIPHRVTASNFSKEQISGTLKAQGKNEQIPFQFCPEFFKSPPKLCSSCGGDSRVPGTCNDVLVSGRQFDCPPGGPYDNCIGYYCQCTNSGTDKNPKITSTTVIDGATGTVVWEPMTLTQYSSLRASTTVTLTELATATTGSSELETVVAAVFAGGVAWWVASQAGAAGAALAIQPPNKLPDGSKEDDPTCHSNPKEECQNCGGADSIGLCKSGQEAGCPCDEVQECPNQPPKCSDLACGGDNGKSQCSAQGNIKGCLCCPDNPPDCPASDCTGDTSGECKSSQLKGCGCTYVAKCGDVLIDPDDPVSSSPSDISAIAAQIFTQVWNADYNAIPGYTATTSNPSTTASCVFVATVFPSSLDSIGGTGTQNFCMCGPTMAGINLAVSGTVTTSYCALGNPAPTGYTQIPAENGHPYATPTPTPTPAPPKIPNPSCNSLVSNKYISPGVLLSNVASFCSDAAQQGGKGAKLNTDYSITYNDNTPEKVVLSLKFKDASYDFSGMEYDCLGAMKNLLTNVCNAPQASTNYNPSNWKAGGTITIGVVDYSIQPQNVRPPPPFGGICGCELRAAVNTQTNKVILAHVWGGGWQRVMSDNGAALWNEIQACLGEPSQWKFEYTSTGPDNGRDEFDASWAYEQGQMAGVHCLGDVVKKREGPSSCDFGSQPN